MVLFLHDSSDIVADAVKMANYMGWDESSGLYFTEILFVTNLITWAVTRLYIFITSAVYGTLITKPIVHMTQFRPAVFMGMPLQYVILKS